MDAERAARADRLLEEALGRAKAERQEYVRQACEDHELRDEVLSLLTWHERAGSFLEQSLDYEPVTKESEPRFVTGEIVAERFEIRCRLRRGGQGEVYEAYDRVMNESVALKAVLPEIAGSERARHRLEQEIRLARKITHPNVCRVHDLFHHTATSTEDETESTTLISMELLRGETLADHLRRETHLPWRKATTILKEVAMGLEAADRAGIVHRDLKPSNIMLVPVRGKLRTVLTDFGLAAGSGLGAASADSPTRSSGGTTWGTPDYMSPEQFAGHKATARSDLFSLGVVGFEILAGTRPYPPDRPTSQELPEDVPKRLESLVVQCLQADATARPDSARQVKERLDELLRTHSRRKVFKQASIAAAAAVLIAFGGMAYLASRPQTIAWTSAASAPQATAEMLAGMQKLREAENIAAIPHFEKALALDPDFFLARVKLVEALLNTGNHKQVEALIGELESRLETSSSEIERDLATAVIARSRLDYHTAVEIYEELWTEHPDDIDVGLTLGAGYEETGQTSRALRQYRFLQNHADTVAGLLGIGRSLITTGEARQGLSFLENTRTPLDGPESQGMLYSILGVANREIGHFAEARNHLRRSLEFRRAADDVRGQSATLTNLAGVEWRAGQTGPARRRLTEALTLARRTGDVTYESFALVNLGATALRLGLLEEAFALHGESLEIELQRGELVELGDRFNTLAEVNIAMGQYEDSIVLLNQAREYSRRSGDSRETAESLDLLGLVRAFQGRPEDSITAFNESLSILSELEVEFQSVDVSMHLAQTHLVMGNFWKAHELLVTNTGLAAKAPDRTLTVCASVTRAEYLLAVGNLTEAESELSRTLPLRDLSTKDASLTHQLAEGVLSLALNELEAAEVILEDVFDQASARGFYATAQLALLQISRARLSSGEFLEAENILSDAIQASEVRRIRPRFAEATLLMAQLKLSQQDYAGAEAWANQSASAAEEFSGRPILFGAYFAKGMALRGLGHEDEAATAFAKAVDSHEWITQQIPTGDLRYYLSRPDIAHALEVITIDR